MNAVKDDFLAVGRKRWISADPNISQDAQRFALPVSPGELLCAVTAGFRISQDAVLGDRKGGNSGAGFRIDFFRNGNGFANDSVFGEIELLHHQADIANKKQVSLGGQFRMKLVSR